MQKRQVLAPVMTSQARNFGLWEVRNVCMCNLEIAYILFCGSFAVDILEMLRERSGVVV